MKFVQFDLIAGQREGEDDSITTILTPVTINAEHVRSFTKRKPNTNGEEQPGTRIAFVNSAALIVNESYEEVMAALNPTVN